MKSLQHKISDKLAKSYSDDAISAGSDYKINLTNTDSLIHNLDKLCVKLHAELKEILSDEILLDSIAIKNAAVIYLHLKSIYSDRDVEWYQHDERYGNNTYPVKFGHYAIFPKQWFKDAIISGKAGQLKNLYDDSIEDDDD